MKAIFISLILLVLTVSITFAAVDITISLPDRASVRLTKIAEWKGKTKEQIVRRAVLNMIEDEKQLRAQRQIFDNLSTVCALPTIDCVH